MREVNIVRQRLVCVMGGVAAIAIGGAVLMLGPALGAGVSEDNSGLVAAHQRACTALKGREDGQELRSCVDYLIGLQAGPVEVFVSRDRRG